MLLIHNHKSELPEYDSVLDDGMSAHEDVHLTEGKVGEDCLSLLALHHSREQLHTNIHIAEKLSDGV